MELAVNAEIEGASPVLRTIRRVSPAWMRSGGSGLPARARPASCAALISGDSGSPI
nr:hypothetical protein [Tanacetum cinerariifolium]